ncbi:MAG TPA: Hsp70 family protein, partial [Nannocystaceae bacterium]|nr:Hsp70 family protein [Nannocystaceae bacterium]
VLQGERTEARYNRTLGKFHLEGIMPAPRGVPKVEVTFDIDANGIVHVSATDKATGKQQQVKVTATSGLSEQDIGKMVDDAKKHADEDERRKRSAENKNHLEAMVLTTERHLGEAGGLPAELKREVEAALADAKAALESADDERIAAAKPRLERAAHGMAQAMYAGKAAANEGASREQEPRDEDVIDAEFEEKAS